MPSAISSTPLGSIVRVGAGGGVESNSVHNSVYPMDAANASREPQSWIGWEIISNPIRV